MTYQHAAGLLVPGDRGGSEGTILDVVLLAEEMGRAGLVSPYVASAVVATSKMKMPASRSAGA